MRNLGAPLNVGLDLVLVVVGGLQVDVQEAGQRQVVGEGLGPIEGDGVLGAAFRALELVVHRVRVAVQAGQTEAVLAGQQFRLSETRQNIL